MFIGCVVLRTICGATVGVVGVVTMSAFIDTAHYYGSTILRMVWNVHYTRVSIGCSPDWNRQLDLARSLCSGPKSRCRP